MSTFIGDLVRAAIELGATEQLIADEVGVSQSTINRWKKDRLSVPLVAVERLMAFVAEAKHEDEIDDEDTD